MSSCQDSLLQTNNDDMICCICLGTLPTNVSDFTRNTCCGNGIHLQCMEDLRKSNMTAEQKNSCPTCRETYPKTNAGHINNLIKWIAKGKTWAMYIMAQRYRDGDVGLKKSPEKAVTMFLNIIENSKYSSSNATNATYINSIYDLAVMCKNGEGIQKSNERALNLYKEAAKQEHSAAQYNLGLMYILGDGVEQSDEIARKWWTRSANLGYQKAIESLVMLVERAGKTNHLLINNAKVCKGG